MKKLLQIDWGMLFITLLAILFLPIILFFYGIRQIEQYISKRIKRFK